MELLRLAAWRASRSGLDGDLLGPTGRPTPSETLMWMLVRHVRPALQESGDLDIVEELLSTLLRRGTGAAAQRAVYRKAECLSAVVNDVAQRTAGI